jgi:hypothetical protein
MAQCSSKRVPSFYIEEAAMSTNVAGGTIRFINKLSLYEIHHSFPSIIILSFYSRSSHCVHCLPCKANGVEKSPFRSLSVSYGNIHREEQEQCSWCSDWLWVGRQ